jgi:sugar transferase (PEP-CTERM/EpsH1 system associated)
MPARIMHVVDSLGKGGLENGLVNLIERMDPLRFEHVVCAIRGLGPNLERLPRERVQVVCLAKEEGTSRVQTPALARAIRRFRPDVLHSRNWGAIEGVIAGRWAGSCALVHSEHGLESEAGAPEPWRRNFLRRVAFELAHRVVSVSGQLRDLHAKRTGFPKERITIVHNGVDSARFFPDGAGRAAARAELGLAEADFCVGCVGNLLPVKDHLTLLRAVSEIGTGDWRLVMIGEGPERPKIEAFLRERPEVARRVSLVGSSSRVPELLRALDGYVLPSVAEGISNSLLEAMATGLPVAASRVGGNPEVVVDGESGLLFPAADVCRLTETLMRLWRDRDLRARLAARAMARVRSEFSIEAMVEKYERLYESLLPAAAPARAAARV